MIIVDTNILFGWFWEQSVHRKLLEQIKGLHTPQKAIEELEKYRKEICRKANINTALFEKSKEELSKKIIVENRQTYQHKIKEAITISPDPGDSEFFALCLARNAPLWSQDKKLQQQDNVPVFTTEEILQLDF